MPTTRPRHQVTETPAIARALDRAARRWPGESRGQLLLRLVATGDAALEHDNDQVVAERQAAVRSSSGAYPDAFGTHHLDDLRADWPA